MKYYLYVLVLFTSVFCNAQNWEPFPYDSVYFINVENDKDVILPIVKTYNPDNILIDMNTAQEFEILRSTKPLSIPHINSDNLSAHWLGDSLQYNDGILKFKSLVFDTQFEINFNLTTHSSDTQSIELEDNVMNYFRYYIDSTFYDAELGDTLKSINIQLLDSNYEQIMETYESSFPLFEQYPACLNSLADIDRSSYNNRILIGKSTGIKEMPNLAFYPYCSTFKKHITVDSLKQLLSQPLFEVGDRIDHTYIAQGIVTNYFVEYQYKKVIILSGVNPANKTFNFAMNVWERKIDLLTNTIIEENFYPAQVQSHSYDYGDFIFDNAFARLNSDWGIPLIGYYSNVIGFPEASANFAGITTLEYDLSQASSAIKSNCVTYHTLNDEPFGDIHNFDINEFTPKQLQVIYTNGSLLFNEDISSNLELLTIDGKQILSNIQVINAREVQLPNYLQSGMYLVILKEFNVAYKIVVNQ